MSGRISSKRSKLDNSSNTNANLLTSLNLSLSENKRLQDILKKKLSQIQKEKKRNRQDAIKVLSNLQLIWNEIDHVKNSKYTYHSSDKSKENRQYWKKITNEYYKRLEKGKGEKEVVVVEEEEEEEEANTDTDKTTTKRKRARDRISKNQTAKISKSPAVNVKHVKRQWPHDPTRKWKSNFFSDPMNSSPQFPIETYDIGKEWNDRNEIKLLTEIIQEYSQGIPNDNDINFEQISQQLKERHSFHRTALECRNKYLYDLSSKINKSKFTKQESMQLLTLAKCPSNPSWAEIALQLQSNRTPWQCFSFYQSSLNPIFNMTEHWMTKQDECELLLKYIVVKGGPQVVWNMNACQDISTELFPLKTTATVFSHAHASLMNPNISPETWNINEERKLALCVLKIYKDSPNPLVPAALHFPNRTSKAVADKWHRQLDPKYYNSSFTKEEDDALLQAVASRAFSNNRQRGSYAQWSYISRNVEALVHRRPCDLMKRWLEIASEEEVIKRVGSISKLKYAVRRSGLLLGSNDSSNSRELENDALLDPNDFVIREKKFN